MSPESYSSTTNSTITMPPLHKQSLVEQITHFSGHLSLILFVFVVLFLCFTSEFVLFTWHPFLLSLGWILLQGEALLIFDPNNLLLRGLFKSHHKRVLAHWIAQSFGLTLSLLGVLAVFVNKNNLGKEHFKTWHALTGLCSVVSAILSTILGAAILLGRFESIKKKTVKLWHVFSALLTVFLGSLTVFLSLYSKWFGKRTNFSVGMFIFCWFLVVFMSGFLLRRPLKRITTVLIK